MTRNLRVFLQSVGAWGAFAVPTGTFGALMPVVYPVMRRRFGEREAQRRLRRVVHRYCRMYFPILNTVVPPTSVSFQPPDWVPPVDGRGTIFIANHSGTLDIVLLMAHIDDFIILGKGNLYRVPVFGWALDAMGTIFTERENRFEALDVFDELATVLESGDSILAFPQGHRLERWRKKDLKRGIFRLALRTGAPVVPVAIVNSPGFLKPHQFWFDITRPVTAWLVACDPVFPEGSDRDPKAVNALRHEVWQAIDTVIHRFEGRHRDKPSYRDLWSIWRSLGQGAVP